MVGTYEEQTSDGGKEGQHDAGDANGRAVEGELLGHDRQVVREWRDLLERGLAEEWEEEEETDWGRRGEKWDNCGTASPL